MSIKRYEGRDLEPSGFQPHDQFVTYDDHEAAVRLKMAEAERNGRAACRLALEWRCRSWGMTDAEISKCETFSRLLDAYTMCVHQTGRNLTENNSNHLQHEPPINYAE
mgnify:CR=1 FL=1